MQRQVYGMHACAVIALYLLLWKDLRQLAYEYG